MFFCTHRITRLLPFWFLQVCSSLRLAWDCAVRLEAQLGEADRPWEQRNRWLQAIPGTLVPPKNCRSDRENIYCIRKKKTTCWGAEKCWKWKIETLESNRSSHSYPIPTSIFRVALVFNFKIQDLSAERGLLEQQKQDLEAVLLTAKLQAMLGGCPLQVAGKYQQKLCFCFVNPKKKTFLCFAENWIDEARNE